MRILYLYNRPNWAIHNVGKYWQRVLGDSYEFVFADSHHYYCYDPAQFDLIWWGYSEMVPSILAQMHHVGAFLGGKPWRQAQMPPVVTVIHDPCEIYPNHPAWLEARPHYRHLKRFTRLAVTSHQMQQLLQRIGFDCALINTNSLLPLSLASAIEPQGLRIFSRGWRLTVRKNLPLARAIRSDTAALVERFDLYYDWHVRPINDYIALIDAHNCYLCTSWQEGGPLPLLDAMRRGCAVLTTPVGQTDEWVQEGVNGFICHTRAEFSERIRYLAANPQALAEMRLASLGIAASRSDELVRAQLHAFLDSATAEFHALQGFTA